MQHSKRDVDAYIATLPEDQADIQKRIRTLLRTFFDKEVMESLQFSVPTYHIRGKLVISIQSGFHYTAIYLYDRSLLESFCEQFDEYHSGRNCIRIAKSENPTIKVEWILGQFDKRLQKQGEIIF